ncbi:prepilin-type N-terminal cleavage/methylation domain-containing protein [Candidatus Kuenenbacteria bacterium]|nr:prepilin-type N-terminal cleavage/methylation domain-containing protein [Candidatus Kuenenbacteria bacterium]
MLKVDVRGFTLIELLVSIAIIGLLASMAMMSLGNARQKSRDARRVADVKQIQNALEMYFNDNTFYPYGTIGGVVQSTGALGDTSHRVLSSQSGFNTSASGITYMTKVSSDPGVESGYIYDYESSNGSTYTITFGLAGKTGNLTCATYGAACCTASPKGITCN